LTSFVEANEKTKNFCYPNNGDNMRNEILINEVLKELDGLTLKLNMYYTMKNLKGKKGIINKKNKRELDEE